MDSSSETPPKHSVLITGAASGIGRAAALAFAKAGYKPILTDIDVDGGEETIRLVRQTNPLVQPVFYPADITDAEQIHQLFMNINGDTIPLKVCFNNAGIEGSFEPINSYPDDEFARVIDVNVKGVYNCMKHEIPILVSNGGGCIVNCSSIAGVSGFPLLSAYTASKHAVIGLTRAVAKEVAKENVRVNAVCPGPIETPMLGRFKPPYTEEVLVGTVPMGRLGRPEEIAEAVVFLCSEAASFITGQAVSVDGGINS